MEWVGQKTKDNLEGMKEEKGNKKITRTLKQIIACATKEKQKKSAFERDKNIAFPPNKKHPRRDAFIYNNLNH